MYVYIYMCIYISGCEDAQDALSVIRSVEVILGKRFV